MTFTDQLAFGQIGEGYIAKWLRGRGWNVLPVYEKEIDTGKGPRLFMSEFSARPELIAPDLLAIKGGSFVWVEAKRKTRFSWYGKGKYWVTGIDHRHYVDYIQVQEELGVDVWLMLLHTESATWQTDIDKRNAPETCPVGLYGRTIKKLMLCISHDSEKYGPTGMVYWRDTDLIKLAELADVIPTQRQETQP